MAGTWTVPSDPSFTLKPVSFSARRSITLNGPLIYMDFEATFQQGTEDVPSEDQFAAWMDDIRTSLIADGWESVSVTQGAPVTRTLVDNP